MDRFILLNIILIIILIGIIILLTRLKIGSLGIKVVIIVAVLFYILNIIFYKASDEKDLLMKEEEIKRFIFGPILILLVYGLIRSGISDKNLSSVILFDSVLLASLFILFYGYTILIKNRILTVIEGDRRIYYGNQFNSEISNNLINNYVG